MAGHQTRPPTHTPKTPRRHALVARLASETTPRQANSAVAKTPAVSASAIGQLHCRPPSASQQRASTSRAGWSGCRPIGRHCSPLSASGRSPGRCASAVSILGHGRVGQSMGRPHRSGLDATRPALIGPSPARITSNYCPKEEECCMLCQGCFHPTGPFSWSPPAMQQRNFVVSDSPCAMAIYLRQPPVRRTGLELQPLSISDLVPPSTGSSKRPGREYSTVLMLAMLMRTLR